MIDNKASSSNAQLADKKKKLLEKLKGSAVKKSIINRYPRNKYAPLSYAQERLWFFEKLSPGTSVYNMPFAIKMHGKLNLRVLEDGFNQIIAKHEILRTVFVEKEGEPYQVLLKDCHSSLEIIDLSSQSPAELEINHLINQMIQRPFNLRTGPLIKAVVYCLANDEYIFLVNMHHIISDGWSVGVFFRDLTTLYQAIISGQTLSLSNMDIQYIDYSIWQREALDEKLEQDLAYWRQKLAGNTEMLQLPYDYDRPKVQNYSGKKFHFSLSPALTKSVNELTKKLNVSQFMLLMAAFNVLLYSYTNTNDMVLGTVIANRHYREIEGLIGFFANTLAFRIDLANNPSFTEIAYKVKEVALEAYLHQDLPFNLLTRELHPHCDLTSSPLFNAVFVLQNMQMLDMNLPNITISPYAVHTHTSKFDLSLMLMEMQGEIKGHFEYSTELFKDHTIEQMAHNYVALLHAVVAQVDIPLANLLTKIQCHATSGMGNNLQLDHTEQWKLIFNDTYITDQQNDEADFNIKGWISSYTNQPIPKPEMKEWVEKTVERILSLKPTNVLEIGTGTGLLLSRVAPVCNSYFGTDISEKAINYVKRYLIDQNQQLSHVELRQCSADNMQNIPDKGYDCAIINSVVQYFPNAEYLLDVLDGCISKLSEDGFIFLGDIRNLDLLEAFHASVQLVQMQPGCRINQFKINIENSVTKENELALSPSFFFALKKRFSRISNVEIRYKHGVYDNEMTCFRYDVILFVGAVNTLAYEKSFTCDNDISIASIEKIILDNQSSRFVIKAIPNVRTSYFNNVIHEIQHVDENQLLGDFKRMLDEKENKAIHPNEVLQLAEEYKLVSELFYSENVESHCFDAVFVPMNQRSNQSRIAFRSDATIMDSLSGWPIEHYANRPLKEKLSVDLASELRDYLKQQLPSYMVPSSFVILDSLPLTANGKIDRKMLASLQPKSNAIQAENAIKFRPITETQKKIAEVYSEILGLTNVSIHDDFFHIGGHSLLVTRLAFKLGKIFNRNIPLRLTLTETTIAKLAKAIDLMSTETNIEQDFDLAKEIFLDDDIRAESSGVVSQNYNNVLLTGGTGFLGAFLLRELLEKSSANVYCLVRSDDPHNGQARLIQNMKSYGIWNDEYLNRIFIVQGTLAKPCLGLDENTYKHLASLIDVIYHNGAIVNFVYPYESLKGSNVEGTKEILRLASTNQIKPVHFVSTLGVFSSRDCNAANEIDEDHISDYGPDDNTGYSLSKWVAEKIIEVARQRNIPISIYRIGRISGESKTGACQMNDYFWRLLQACIQMGKVFVSNDTTPIDLSPVDYVSSAIIHISRQSTAIGKNFHISNPVVMTMKQFFTYVKQIGYSLKELAYNEWRESLYVYAENHPDEQNIQALLPAIAQMKSKYQPRSHSLLNTLSYLNKANISCPKVDRSLLDVYFKYFIANGYIKSPHVLPEVT